MDPAARRDAATLPAEGAVLQRNTELGGSKPLHRFIRGEPKSTGIVLVILGSAIFIQSIPISEITMGAGIHPGFWLGPMFIACGIVYISAEYNPTKGTVTASLALGIVVLLVALGVAFIRVLPNLIHHQYGYHHPGAYTSQVMLLHILFEVYIFTGVIILIVMSVLAGVSLRSAHSKARVVMTQSQPSAE